MNSRTNKFSSQQMVIYVLIAIVGLLFGVIYFFSNTVISGQEFAPELFQERSYSYSRVPGTMIRMSSTSLTTATSPCGKTILSTLPNSPTTTWHVAKATQGAIEESYGPAVILKYLTAVDANGNRFWDAWSFHHPELAAVAWPIVQQAALQDLYFCMPELFAAMSESNAASEAAKLKKQLTLICLRAAIQRVLSKNDINKPSQLFAIWSTSFAAEWKGDSEVDALVADLQKH